MDPPSSPHSVDDFVRGYEHDGQLRGFRCGRCGTKTATWGLACSSCGQGPLEEVDLAREGQVLSGTIVTVASDEFVNDAPYAYVLVELDGGGRVSGWIPGAHGDDAIAPGSRVRFVASYKPGVQFEPAAPVASPDQGP